MDKQENKLLIPIWPDCANKLNIGRNTMYALAHTRDFPSVHIGRKVLVNVKLLEQWLELKAKKGGY